MADYQVTWRGFVDGSTGYDRASREYLLALDRQGVDVRIEPLSYTGKLSFEGLNPDQVSRLTELIQKSVAADKKKVLVYHSQPNGIDPVKEREQFDKVIVLTVWETTRVPNNWIDGANQADLVIVPSMQNIEALKDSGITSPILVVPHGADSDTYNPNNPPLPLLNIGDKFAFLSVFQWQHRKNPEALLQAYWQEFTAKDNVCLILKTYYGSNQVTKEQNRGIVNTIASYKQFIAQQLGLTSTAPIYLSVSSFSDEDLKGLYTASDCFVLPTRGEGVGLPYIEALCSGVPVIATAWGGSMDFLNKENSYLVDYRLEQTDSRANGGISPNFNQLFTSDMEWAEVDINSLRLQMRRAYEAKDLTKQKGINGRKQMESLTWDDSGKSLKACIESILKG